MLSEKLHAALNEQINAELWSAYLYLSMSMDAEAKGLKGVANWFYVQWLEEQDHARILMNYINSRDGKVCLKPIEPVRTEWDSVLEMFQETLKHEKVVTGLINNLAAIAAEDRDFASSNMLVWFVDEQVEEEESARDMIFAAESVEGDKYGMYQLDKELAARTYTQASPLASGAE
ncbi:MAG: ferritin [Rikenellaceae bacterium]|nr:ferritin [Rikenellaceae bacterium]